jgi:hypothetical protein
MNSKVRVITPEQFITLGTLGVPVFAGFRISKEFGEEYLRERLLNGGDSRHFNTAPISSIAAWFEGRAPLIPYALVEEDSDE